MEPPGALVEIGSYEDENHDGKISQKHYCQLSQGCTNSKLYWDDFKSFGMEH